MPPLSPTGRNRNILSRPSCSSLLPRPRFRVLTAAEPAAGSGEEELCSGRSGAGTGSPGAVRWLRCNKAGQGTRRVSQWGHCLPCFCPPAARWSFTKMLHHFTPTPSSVGDGLHRWDPAKVSWRAWSSRPEPSTQVSTLPVTSSLCLCSPGGSSPFPSSTHHHPSYAKGQARPPRAWKRR